MGVAPEKVSKEARGRTISPETPVAIRARDGGVDEELREYVHQRAGFKLGKYAPQVDRISVRFEDLNGPKGGPDSRCAVKVALSRHESVVVEVVEADYRQAFDHAMDATERAVRRTLERVWDKARRG
jgi:ribosome-associated translation inhibitor RaiA